MVREANLFRLTGDLTQSEVMQAIHDVEISQWREAGEIGEKPQIKYGYPERQPEQLLMNFATGGRMESIPGKDQMLTEGEAQKLEAVLLAVEVRRAENNRDKVSPVRAESDRKYYPLEPEELSAWLQASARAGQNMPVGTWVETNNIGLAGLGETISNGKEEIYIETQPGQRRATGNGNLSEPLSGHYGGVVGTKTADGDPLNIYMTDKVYNGIRSDGYGGPIFVMQQMDGGKPDELKIGYAANLGEFKEMMESGWADPEKFRANNEGAYAQLTKEQYEQLKSGLKADPALTLEGFAQKNNIELVDTHAPEPATQKAESILPESLRSVIAGIGRLPVADVLDQNSIGSAGAARAASAPAPKGRPPG